MGVAQNKQKVLYGKSRPEGEMPKGRALKQCHCGEWFSLPACHASLHRSCTSVCGLMEKARKKEQARRERERSCEICGKTFSPRGWQLSVGGGRFCSHPCASKHTFNTDEVKAAIARGCEKRREGFASGRIKFKSGADNPRWTGGKRAARDRRVASGKSAAEVREYRKKNPTKTREWAQNRKNRKQGKLPRGTIAKLMELQREKCAYCEKGIAKKFHVDHITPLALGGLHTPENIQLLCPTCNVRKWAKCPVEFAQSIGLLV